NVARAVEGDAGSTVHTTAAQVSREEQRGAAGIQLRDEGISTAAVALQSIHERETYTCGACDVRVSGAVQGDSSSEGDVAAEEGRVHQCRAAGVQLGDESAVGVGGLEGTGGDREVRIIGVARDVGTAGGIDRNRQARIADARVAA